MPGYANRTILLDFPELSEDGDKVHVLIRNPKTMSKGELEPRDVPLGPDGKPQEAEAERAVFEVLAKLVIGWHVYDSTVLADDQPLLDFPATPETVAKLPLEIQNRMALAWKAVVSPEA